MRAIQKKVLQLVREIDSVCAAHKIPYALYGKTCGSAVKLGKFATNECRFHIMAYARDFADLEQALNAVDPEHRAVETLATNGKLARNELRYVDTTTTLFSRDDCVRYEHLGATVVVHPVFTDAPKATAMAAAQTLARLNSGCEYNTQLMSKSGKRAMKLARIPGTLNGMAKLTYRSLDKDSGKRTANKLYFYHENELVSTSLPLLIDTKLVPFEDTELPVPSDAERFMKKLYGKAWEQEVSKAYESSEALATICDPTSPYAESIEYLKECGVDVRKLQETLHDNFQWRCTTLAPWQAKKSGIYSYGLLARDRIDMYVELEGKLDELRAASQAGDVTRLEELLGRYFHFTRKYLRKNLGFFTTQEIFDMATQVWVSKQGDRKYADQVYALVPEEHKTKDLKSYVDQYR